MATDTSKITGAADDLSDKLTKGGGAAKVLGAEIANAFAAQDARIAALEAGGGGGVVPPEPPATGGKITNFSAASSSSFQIDGENVQPQNANKSWSINQVDDYTLRFEVRSGDKWEHDDSSMNRSEIEFQEQYDEGVTMSYSDIITVKAGPPNTSGSNLLVQCHATTNVNPTYCPFSIGITPPEPRENIRIVLQEPNQGWNQVWIMPLVRDKAMKFDCKVKMGAAGNGKVEVWLDGNQIVDFNGKVGATNSKYYWKCGLYRGQVPETMTAEHKNIITG